MLIRTIIALLAASIALAAPLMAPAQEGQPLDYAMAEGSAMKGPRGFYELCQREPETCPVPAENRGPVMVRLSDAAMKALDWVNRQTNAAFEPVTDIKAHGVSDLWQMPSITADCEDYVIAKRAALIARGWPAEALLIGVVKGTLSPYHAVLIVRTDLGDLVLDNMRDDILGWTQSGYEWVVRQSQRDPYIWVRIIGRREAPALSSPSIRTAG
ncbi:MAG: transglutaminase-like cysteine peptidase [Neomegalonema sp.]|nr:transglutaminase-like cysteine peptidase [Neomegalonema sp.]